MREFTNYVFDFYGTLVDVHTDENKPALWRFMADLYAAYGCLYNPDDLRDAFWRFDAQERDEARCRSGLAHPEIRIERVFLRLLLETPARPCNTPLAGRPVGDWRRRHARIPESVLRALQDGDWAAATANAFRIHSRDTAFVGNEMRSDMLLALRCGVQGIYLNTAGAPPDSLRDEASRLLAPEHAAPSAMPLLIPSGRLRDLLSA